MKSHEDILVFVTKRRRIHQPFWLKWLSIYGCYGMICIVVIALEVVLAADQSHVTRSSRAALQAKGKPPVPAKPDLPVKRSEIDITSV